MAKKKSNFSYIGISLVVLLFGIWAVPKIVDNLKSHEKDMATIGPVPEFSLTNHHGENITQEDLLGKVYVVEFFFTTCPSICPVMHKSMVKIQDKYFGNPNVAFVSVTINPEYDTPETLNAYAKENNVTNNNWQFLTGDIKDIYALANQGFNLYVAEAPEVEGGFEHSGFFALVDKKGNIRSRLVEQGNPKIYYNGLEDSDVRMLIEDIKNLL